MNRVSQNFNQDELFNYASIENGAQIIQVSSESPNCPCQNILNSQRKSIWLSEEGLPHSFVIDISNLQNRPKFIQCFGFDCWHDYLSNPALIELAVATDDCNFITWVILRPELKAGVQLFTIDSIGRRYNYIKIIIKETFGAAKAYLNQIFLFEQNPLIQINKQSIISSLTDSNLPTPNQKNENELAQQYQQQNQGKMVSVKSSYQKSNNGRQIYVEEDEDQQILQEENNQLQENPYQNQLQQHQRNNNKYQNQSSSQFYKQSPYSEKNNRYHIQQKSLENEDLEIIKKEVKQNKIDINQINSNLKDVESIVIKLQDNISSVVDTLGLVKNEINSIQRQNTSSQRMMTSPERNNEFESFKPTSAKNQINQIQNFTDQKNQSNVTVAQLLNDGELEKKISDALDQKWTKLENLVQNILLKNLTGFEERIEKRLLNTENALNIEKNKMEYKPEHSPSKPTLRKKKDQNKNLKVMLLLDKLQKKLDQRQKKVELLNSSEQKRRKQKRNQLNKQDLDISDFDD